jgi:hypothetical protein
MKRKPRKPYVSIGFTREEWKAIDAAFCLHDCEGLDVHDSETVLKQTWFLWLVSQAISQAIIRHGGKVASLARMLAGETEQDMTERLREIYGPLPRVQKLADVALDAQWLKEHSPDGLS